MAQQTPNPSVQNHRKEPVLNQKDSDAGDGFLDIRKVNKSIECLFNAFRDPMGFWILCLGGIPDAFPNLIGLLCKPIKFLEWILNIRSCIENLLFSHSLSFADDWIYKWSTETLQELDYLEDSWVLPLKTDKRRETAQRLSSFVIYTIMCLWFLQEICRHTLLGKHLGAASVHVQGLHKEHGPLSIVFPLLGLFSFMAFVWAVATMILLGAKFTRMHSAMFLFWAFLMNVRSDNSISALYLPILGIFFGGWYAVCSWKSERNCPAHLLLDSSLDLRR